MLRFGQIKSGFTASSTKVTCPLEVYAVCGFQTLESKGFDCNLSLSEI
ncbi:hypothetical protein [uncultured Helicobacter sp.]|nr:hypothetical protein [uncultured Helicobacter sp.]